MPNGVPFCTGFIENSSFNANQQNLSSPVQTLTGGTNWTLPQTDGFEKIATSATGSHAAAIKQDGTLWLWGRNYFSVLVGGMLGDNSNINRSSPVQTVSTGTNWKQVALGETHSAAIKTDGTLWMWGNGSYCRLGGGAICRSSPAQTISGTNWKQVALGVSHSSAIKTDGTLWLWGRAACGALGNNSTINQCSPVQTVATGTNWKQVSLGRDHSAAIKTDGTLWLWGCNTSGQLGINNCTINQSSPVQTISTGTNWKQVSIGHYTSAAVKTDGTLWVWGVNSYGQHGVNDTIARSTPVQTRSGVKWVGTSVNNIVHITGSGRLYTSGRAAALGDNTYVCRSQPVQTSCGGTDWVSASSGDRFTIATKIGGKLWTWGYASCGRLGNNSVIGAVSVPIQTISSTNNWSSEYKYCALGAGCAHSASIKCDGTLWLWGLNCRGQLGNNSTITQSSPIQTISSGTDWCHVALGDLHSAAVKTDGTLWLWGDNSDGELGNSDTISNSSPVQTVTTGTNWKQVALGAAHSASVKTDGTLWLWGSGADGRLGTNSTVSVSSPVQTVTAGTNWRQVALGNEHSAAIKTDGTLWLWGKNLNGQLGSNSTTNHSSPVQTVSNISTWKQVSLGNQHSTALRTNGTLWSWGLATCGQLGNNSTTDRSSPVQTVTANNAWVQVSAGGCHTSAIKEDSRLWVWGSADFVQLGVNIDGVNRSSPVQTISTVATWKQVVSGERHNLAVNDSNQLFLWGNNTDGQVGCILSLPVISESFDLGCQFLEKEYLIDVYPNIVPWMKSPGLWLWGSNCSGQLGTNSTVNTSSPTQTITNGSNWFSISSGLNGHSAAIKTDGTLWLWGSALGGRLGNNSTLSRSSPVQTVSTGTNWKQVSLGCVHSASIKTDGTLWLWGSGVCGRLGDNSTIPRSSPVQTVSTGTNWKQISSGACHSASIKTDGTLWLWGTDTCGALGDNSTINQSSPVQTVTTGTNWKQVSVGCQHSAAIKTDGTLWIWGRNDSGALGIQCTIDQSSPVQTVTTGNNWKQLSLGENDSSAIKTDGTLWLWGCNSLGQLGINSTIDQSSPVQTVSTQTNWKTVNLGTTHSTAIKVDGTLWLWGSGIAGKLGNYSGVCHSSPIQTISSGNTWKQVSPGVDSTLTIREEYDW